mmetsp:Transcript_11571/g.18577  ORF Transcript_11571/g.18577 Transcript_11571/m.18577 type:complete len:83 (-) Transcript_11571:322-570(-)
MISHCYCAWLLKKQQKGMQIGGHWSLLPLELKSLQVVVWELLSATSHWNRLLEDNVTLFQMVLVLKRLPNRSMGQSNVDPRR